MKKKLQIKNNLKRCSIALAFFLFAFSFVVNAQSLKRQSIGSGGNSYSGGGTIVQQSTGQPYGTTSNYNNSIRFNPGFQQPVFRIETIKSSINAKVFPNPAAKQITIESIVELENVLVQISDMSGKLIIKEKINTFKRYSINCSDWANGAYLITLTGDKNELYSAKLIISK